MDVLWLGHLTSSCLSFPTVKLESTHFAVLLSGLISCFKTLKLRVHVFTKYFCCCCSCGMEPWLPNCNLWRLWYKWLRLVTGAIGSFVNFSQLKVWQCHVIQKAWESLWKEKKKKKKRRKDVWIIPVQKIFHSGKIMLNRYCIDWQICWGLDDNWMTSVHLVYYIH